MPNLWAGYAELGYGRESAGEKGHHARTVYLPTIRFN